MPGQPQTVQSGMAFPQHPNLKSMPPQMYPPLPHNGYPGMPPPPFMNGMPPMGYYPPPHHMTPFYPNDHIYPPPPNSTLPPTSDLPMNHLPSDFPPNSQKLPPFPQHYNYPPNMPQQNTSQTDDQTDLSLSQPNGVPHQPGMFHPFDPMAFPNPNADPSQQYLPMAYNPNMNPPGISPIPGQIFGQMVNQMSPNGMYNSGSQHHSTSH